MTRAAHNKTVFTAEQDRLIRMLIDDGCPTGEIAETVGVTHLTLRAHYPEAKGTKAQIKEWQSVRAFQTECERKYYHPKTGLPSLLAKPRETPEERRSRRKAESARTRREKAKQTQKPKDAPYTPAQVEKARELLTAGWSFNATAREIDLSVYWVKKLFPGMGHPAKRASS